MSEQIIAASSEPRTVKRASTSLSAEQADELQARQGDAPATQVLQTALTEVFPGTIAMVSSFGAESVALLHLIAQVDAATPVLFVDTGRHFDETLEYRDRLIDHLGLKDVRSVGPSAEEIAALDADSTRATWDPDGCCAFRKVKPLERALAGFDAWITGRKRFQGGSRLHLPVVELSEGKVKFNPLANWAKEDLDAYAAAHDLPAHPLVAQGFPSIGCWPCTQPAEQDGDLRAGRWQGLDKTECGIHLARAPGAPNNVGGDI